MKHGQSATQVKLFRLLAPIERVALLDFKAELEETPFDFCTFLRWQAFREL
jgi:hypothetical protein